MLRLRRLTRADMGAYLCIASNGIPSPVSKRIMVHVHCKHPIRTLVILCKVPGVLLLFLVHPLVKVPDQIIATSVGSNVSLSCVVESSPKSVNMWMRRGKDNARKYYFTRYSRYEV